MAKRVNSVYPQARNAVAINCETPAETSDEVPSLSSATRDRRIGAHSEREQNRDATANPMPCFSPSCVRHHTMRQNQRPYSVRGVLVFAPVMACKREASTSTGKKEATKQRISMEASNTEAEKLHRSKADACSTNRPANQSVRAKGLTCRLCQDFCFEDPRELSRPWSRVNGHR